MSDAKSTTALEFQVPRTLTIYDVLQLDKEFVSLTGLDRGLSLNLSKVEEIDGSGLQWLLAVKARVEAAGGALQLLQTPEAVRAVVELAGVMQTFKLTVKGSDE